VESAPFFLPVVFFAIALFYAAAGFGGGTGYLAALALSGINYLAIPQITLACNVIVSGGGVWHFGKGGHYDMRRILPFFVLSIPMAYLGGRVEISKGVFNLLLGLSLVAAGGRMMFAGASEDSTRRISSRTAWMAGLPIGAGLGFLSGLVGVGGGIFLAPVLLLMGWTNAKQTAAAASLFILVNSTAGLTGQLIKGIYLDAMIVPLGAAALVGGQIGSRVGAYRMRSKGVRRLLAAIIIVVGLRMLWKAI
jgi:uncharacterized membrane protein YfcA